MKKHAPPIKKATSKVPPRQPTMARGKTPVKTKPKAPAPDARSKRPVPPARTRVLPVGKPATGAAKPVRVPPRGIVETMPGEIGVVSPVIPAGQPSETEALAQHARRSPSSLKNREMCVGFEPHKKDTVWAEEGHNLHRYMELWAAIVQEPDRHIPDGDEIAALEKSFVNDQSTVIDMLTGYVGPLISSHDRIFLEHKMDLRPLNLPGCDFGTADFLGISKDENATLVDYKFGKVEVEDPEENVQFHAYAVAAFLEFPQLRVIRVISLQPRLNSVGEAVFTRDDIPRLSLRLKVITERQEEWVAHGEPIEALAPQASLCEYCNRVGYCPAVAEFALKLSPATGIPENLEPHANKDNPTALGQLASWAKVIEAAGKDLGKKVNTEAQAGSDVEGFHLVKSTTPSSIIDPVGLGEALEKDLGFTKEQVYSCAEISLGKVEEVVKKQTPKGQKEAAAQKARRDIMDGGFIKQGFPYSFLKKGK